MSARWMIALSTLALGACGRDARPADRGAERGEPAAHGERAAEAAEGRAAPVRVRVSDRVAREAGITTAAVELAALPAIVELTGEVAADPDHVAQVPVRVSGRVVAVQFQEGQRVAVGQTLAVIESSEVARVRAELTSTMTRADAVHKRVARLGSMMEAGTASAQELEAARAEASALDAEVAGARQSLSSMGGGGGAARLALRAPIAGVVVRRSAVVGQPVSPADTIAEIVDLDRAVFLARLFEHDLARVREGAAATVSLDAYGDAVFPGTVATIGRQVEPTSRAVIARIAIQDQDGRLKLGLFGTAHVVVPDPVTAAWPVVPVSAVALIEDRPTVFVEVGPGELEVRTVELGHADRGRVEITRGLKASERVAVQGLFTLKSLALKPSFGEED